MMVLGAGAMSSCNDLLDLEPITQITPADYYKNADQLANYINSYYNGHLSNPYGGSMFHQATYTSGLNLSDVDTDIAIRGTGNTGKFAKNHWQTSTGKELQGYYGNVRIWNYFLSTVEPRYDNKEISGDDALIRNYIGEAYFFRALNYYRMLVYFGDLPIITEVIPDVDAVIVENSKRAPRNEVARFILKDLDKAVTLLADRSRFNGQRVNKQAAQLLKSRVALFEATFEKYHKGSGRVPGDQEWPGAKMEYNSGKSFDIDGEINFFLTEAMNAAKECTGSIALTANTKVLEPELGTTHGFNPYFEMYGQKSLASNDEVIMWKEYSTSLNVKHNSPYRTLQGDNSGVTRQFVDGFLMTDGLPYYASPLYQGDVSVDDVKADRDYRLQLFLWGETTLVNSDSKWGDALGGRYGLPTCTEVVTETRNVTGYKSRKYYCYDYDMLTSDQILAETACPIFRVAEAMLNYMEACVEKNGSLDATATSYWKALRNRAGVSDDIDATVAATDLNKESQLSVYSGSAQVSPLLFNIRRERVCETFSEGLRYTDLIRWRSFDTLLTTKFVPMGINFWDECYKNEKYDEIVCDGSANSVISGPEQGKYLRPTSVSTLESNELLNGYTWTEAYYLYPLGIVDITSASADRSKDNSNMYQNINWPTQGGAYATK